MEQDIKLISTTELCRRLGVNLQSAFLMSLDLMPVQVGHTGIYWDEDDYLLICETLAAYFQNGGAYLK